MYATLIEPLSYISFPEILYYTELFTADIFSIIPHIVFS